MASTLKTPTVESDPWIDPFQDWKNNVADQNHMTLTQRKLLTDEGIKELGQDLKVTGMHFKNLTLKEMDFEHLYESRILYSQSGVAATERVRKMKDVLRARHNEELLHDHSDPLGILWIKKQKAEKIRKTKENRAQIFSYYGVKLTSSEPDLKSLTKLMAKSHHKPTGPHADTLSRMQTMRRSTRAVGQAGW